MKTEYKIFGVVAAFLIAAMGVYWWWTDAYLGDVEYVGVVALGLSFLLCTMIGGYFWFVARRIDLRPEDRDEGEMADGAGEVGFFSPGSYWPFGLALSALAAGVGPGVPAVVADRRRHHRRPDHHRRPAVRVLHGRPPRPLSR